MKCADDVQYNAQKVYSFPSVIVYIQEQKNWSAENYR